jgi:Copine/C2 domain
VRKSTGSGVLRLKMAGKNLKNVEGFLSKSDPFFELSRKLNAAGGQTWDNVYRSEWLKNNLNPEWNEAAVDLSVLTEGDFDKPIAISIYDHESKGNHTPMGEIEITVNSLKAAAQSRKPLVVKNKGKDAGELYILKADVYGVESITQKMASTSINSVSAPVAVSKSSSAGGQHTFLDYIAGGCELNVAVAIDFTGSNGDPRKPGTLHYLNAGQQNDYESAISAIVSILSKYDSDKQFPVWGFGAKYDGDIQHCFQCGGADKHHGVQGVLNAYHSVFKSGLVMSGPTVFDEVIRVAGQHAASAHATAQARGGQCYTVLLILTDGAVSDVQATSRALEDVSNDPLSVVIVGVGNADFSGMRFLDDFSGGTGKRDIAQFVAFNQYRHNSQALTSETLNEIPNQLSGYFTSVGVRPNPPIGRGDGSIVVEEEEEIDLTLDIGEEEIVVAAGGSDFVNGFVPY